MIIPGLASITFRKLRVEEIIQLMIKANLVGIEWGGDIHVPHGNIAVANKVKKMTLGAGLKIAAYGSYYRFDDTLVFEEVLETAQVLEAPVIRIWAGSKGSAETSQTEREQIIHKSRYIAEMAKKAGIKLAYEYHGNTLTDTVESTASLLEAVNHSNIYSYWQPLHVHSQDQRFAGIIGLSNKLANIHVYHWNRSGKRLPLKHGSRLWPRYIELVRKIPGKRYALIEFVQRDNPKQLLQDANYLRGLLASFSQYNPLQD